MAEDSKQLSAKAVINKLKIDSLPSSVFSSDGSQIIPYGLDNKYPDRVQNAIKNSPTAKGCVRRVRDFVFGLGFGDQGDVVVNRDGQTLNDLLNLAVWAYSENGGFALHFNFNVLGEIIEIFSVDFELVRKLRNLTQVRIANWGSIHRSFLSDKQFDLFLWNQDRLAEQIEASGGFDEFLGNIFYFGHDGDIYPDSFLQASQVSASFESDSQVYSNANIKNGFSSTSLVKIPSLLQGEDGEQEQEKLAIQAEKMHGAENAGSFLMINVPVGVDGTPKTFNMVEQLAPTNVDQLFVNQNEHAEESILKEYRMPLILLGVSSDGMFNMASFNDAFDYKNADTEADRLTIARQFNKFLPFTAFGVQDVEIIPLEMRVQGESQAQTEAGTEPPEEEPEE